MSDIHYSSSLDNVLCGNDGVDVLSESFGEVNCIDCLRKRIAELEAELGERDLLESGWISAEDGYKKRQHQLKEDLALKDKMVQVLAEYLAVYRLIDGGVDDMQDAVEQVTGWAITKAKEQS